MKDIIKRGLITLFSGAFIAYVGLLFSKATVIVTSQYLNINGLSYGLLVVVGLYLMIIFGVYPVMIKMTKATLIVVGLSLIIFGHYVLVNDAMTNIFIGDIVKVLGVVLVILAPTNLLITDKAKKVKDESNAEVIEV